MNGTRVTYPRGVHNAGRRISVRHRRGESGSVDGANVACGTLPAPSTLPPSGQFTLVGNGTRATYPRGVHNAAFASLSGIVETASGSVDGANVAIAGSAATRAYSYRSTDRGRIDGNRMTLTSEQVWLSPAVTRNLPSLVSIALSR